MKQKLGKENPRFIDRTGERHKNKDGEWMTIIECNMAIDCTIQFDDEKCTVISNLIYSNIVKGSVKNPNKPSVCGIGYIGIGRHKSSINRVRTLPYETWTDMLKRCYKEKIKSRYPTYKDVTVCEDWHCFQNFAEWFEDNWKPHMKGWNLDKDLLGGKTKIYSPKNCTFLPLELNMLFRVKRSDNTHSTGLTVKRGLYEVYFRGKYVGSSKDKSIAKNIYKKAKENFSKQSAEHWKNLIDFRAYKALIDYKVEITD